MRRWLQLEAAHAIVAEVRDEQRCANRSDVRRAVELARPVAWRATRRLQVEGVGVQLDDAVVHPVDHRQLPRRVLRQRPRTLGEPPVEGAAAGEVEPRPATRRRVIRGGEEAARGELELDLVRVRVRVGAGVGVGG